ncbi:hypothetical protein V6N12_059143 [Hibiscus sabdariffa]|uniref:RNase H type-1 domain-containing protein n=1 Tax=Hibiscus sabdariffa TaxID=183260 RepID=A0ABR2EUA1_9ROSI
MGIFALNATSPKNGHDSSSFLPSFLLNLQDSIQECACSQAVVTDWNIPCLLDWSRSWLDLLECRCSVGGLFCDQSGSWLSGFQKAIGIMQPLQAELWAILIGLQLAWDTGHKGWTTDIAWIPRACNEPADQLAKTVDSHQLTLHGLTSPPPALTPLLAQDALHLHSAEL